MKDKREKQDKVDICCMRYKCKRCPKQRECEEKENKKKR